MEPCHGDWAVGVAAFNFYVKVTVKVLMYMLFIGSQISVEPRCPCLLVAPSELPRHDAVPVKLQLGTADEGSSLGLLHA